jgi:ankyrin repeat protein
MDDDLSVLVNSVFDADAPQRFAAFAGNINSHAIMRGHWGVAMTPLMAAVQSCRTDVLEALRLRGDVQPNLVEGCMFSALGIAVQNAIHQSALPSMITSLVSAFPGVDVNAPDAGWSTMTPLGYCVNGSSGKRFCRRRRQAALELLRLGANPLLPCNSGGRSAVEEAAVYGDSQMVELLQKHN